MKPPPLLFSSLLLATLVTGCSSDVAPTSALENAGTEAPAFMPTAAKGGVLHQVSAGGPDLCEAQDQKTGCDANYSLVAIQTSDGRVKGQLTDVTKGDDETGAVPIHGEIDCLRVDGNTAYMSGTITTGSLAGGRFLTAVRDNGTSANDPPDQISYTFTLASDNTLTCQTTLDYPFFEVPQGQVKVR